MADFPSKAYYGSEGTSLLFAGSLDSELDRSKVDPESRPSEVPFEFVDYCSVALWIRIPMMGKRVLSTRVTSACMT
ncbi:MAG: hypothetical protein ACREBS_03545 [Nitrososphaerales archaeon]